MTFLSFFRSRFAGESAAEMPPEPQTKCLRERALWAHYGYQRRKIRSGRRNSADRAEWHLIWETMGEKKKSVRLAPLPAQRRER